VLAARRIITAVAFAVSAQLAPAVIRLRRPLHDDLPSVIHVIGDSHVSLFSGGDAMVDPWPRRSVDRHARFRTYRLGSVLAYRLPDSRTSSRGRERLQTVLAFGPVRRGAAVMLSFGEIDCRYHLPRRVATSGRPMPEVVGECVRRYASVVREVRDMGFRTLVWGVIPSLEQREAEENPGYPHWGSAHERNQITRTFNTMLTDELADAGIPVVCLYGELMGADGATPNRGYYMDAVHLSAVALPLAAAAVERALGLISDAPDPPSTHC